MQRPRKFKNVIRFNDMKILHKLLYSFLLVALIAAIIGIFGIYGMVRMKDESAELYQRETKVLPNLAAMIKSVQEIQVDTRNTVIWYNNESKVETYESEIKQYTNDFAKDEKIFSSTATNQEEIANLKQAKQLFQTSLKTNAEDIISAAKSGDFDVAQASLSQGEGTSDSIVQLYDVCLKNRMNESSSMYQNNVRISNELTVLLLSIVVFGVIISIFLGVIISRSINKPIKELLAVVKEFSNGSLSAHINYKSKNEIGILADTLNTTFISLKNIVNDISCTLKKMAGGDMASEEIHDFPGDFLAISDAFRKILGSLNNMISSIRVSSEQVKVSAGQLSDSAQSVARGATEQSETVENLAASVKNINRKADENSENVTNITQDILAVADKVKENESQMHQMVGAMDKISRSSEEIRKIIHVIDSIAFQTNILALNAAVEAARAGSAGKGFSVVADEVRNLAGKSAKAAKQTAEYIENSISKVHEGTEIAEETTETLADITGRMEKMSSTIKEIDIASKNQLNDITHITDGIGQVSSIIQTNSASAEESAAASEELTAQAMHLKTEVEKFLIR